jgi:hypothetical protein
MPQPPDIRCRGQPQFDTISPWGRLKTVSPASTFQLALTVCFAATPNTFWIIESSSCLPKNRPSLAAMSVCMQGMSFCGKQLRVLRNFACPLN